MNADEQKAALASAALAAREMIDARRHRQEQLRKQLVAIDDEIARLEIVASFDGKKISSVPAKPDAAEAAPERKRKNDWVAIVSGVLRQHEPAGIVFIELMRLLRQDHGHQHASAHIKKLLERKEAEGTYHRDDERRWHLTAQPEQEQSPVTSEPERTSEPEPQQSDASPVLAAVRRDGSYAGQLTMGSRQQ